MEPYIPISPETPPINVDVPGEEFGPTVTPEEDGGVTVDFSGADPDLQPPEEHGENLAEYMDDGDLASLAGELISDFDSDLNPWSED